MSDEATWTGRGWGYVCPPEAGPAWRQAADEGIDMSLVERSLDLEPWERLLAHDRSLGLAVILRDAGGTLDE